MTGSTVFNVILALALGYLIWRGSLAVIRMLSTPPPEVNPEDVVAVDQDFKCSVCGAELTMRAMNVQDDAPPRHCREDMDPVWRPA
ncbi:MAG TPA: hypothetical protein VMS99_17560 [Acidimicrobiia bacterium]|jgi:hypothetical protein|nr:hypothetical protein [Acidimicrobiia bacterium]